MLPRGEQTQEDQIARERRWQRRRLAAILVALVAAVFASDSCLEMLLGSEQGEDGAAATAVEEDRLYPSQAEAFEEEQRELLRTITDNCLPKLVCELYSKDDGAAFSDAENSLVALIGASTLNPYGPSKYHYAAHMGQLIRGRQNTGCINFFPSCPFSGEDVRQIARKIKLK